VAEDKDKELKDPCHVSICKAENGWKINCCYEGEKSLSQKAGWVPTSMESRDFVEKTKAAVIERLKKVL
jgi:hypothetical protein